MKRILLASTALVAMAGAASADIAWSGDATLGYNDTNRPTDYSGNPASTSDNHYGFYWSANIHVDLSKQLDNGITAGATFDLGATGSTFSVTSTSAYLQNFTVYLKSDMASLYFGDTSTAAQMHWKSAGDMEADSFTTDWTDSAAEAVIRGDVKYGGVNASISYLYDTNDRQLHQLSIGADGTVGQFSFSVAYQADANSWYGSSGDYHPDEIFGISGSTTFSGATVTVAYAKDNTDGRQSTGIKLAYPVGPVTATVYYVAESGGMNTDPNYGVNLAYKSGPVAVTLDYQNDQGTNKTALDGSYDIGNGLMVYAGYYAQDSWDDSYYLAGTYDLGGGASLLVSYATGGSDDDAYGPNDYQQGTTVEVNFKF
ncbi:MAG: porin [Limimaricola sp.]|uniref:porin n=1 Tax=Limimaricola sp. TaxID=2211665 RepID=UPI001DC58ADA|nr:porin [Limimaricola sp.]MBI1417008.1 porin [Limimaricola sp.]